ncbi:histone-like nucleoid-structuring protein Lsr2 [Streptomyces sp. NPDC019937]|uniref:Lsr2 family DNA-binding protein n=1 Tax=Streptomyces sp. NPDC019937 TaxID=3154787 RepID=UPI00340E4EA2
MNAINALTRLCPPPADRPLPIDWDTVEAALGLRLPTDYKQLAGTYGTGRFADFLHVYHPHGHTEYVDLTGPMPARIREQLQLDYDRGTYPVPYDPRYLFTMGVTDNGNYLFWIADPNDAPDAWRIAVNEARGPRWFTFDGTITEFLFSVLSGETTVPQFPDDLLDEPVGFTRATPSARQPTQTPPKSSVDLEVIREWGRANGYKVPFRGRVPAEVREAWERAHPS